MTDVAPPQHHLGFLDLPGELRNRIYRDVLLVNPPSECKVNQGSRTVYPNLLRTCHQVQEEATSILYGDNTFVAHSSLLTALPHLERKTYPVTAAKCIKMIRRFHVDLRLDIDAHFTAAQAAAAFSNIEILTIEVRQAMFGGSDYRHLKLFEGVRGVGQAKVYGSIMTFRKYAHWLEKSLTTPVDEEPLPFEADEPKIADTRDIWLYNA